ncbi:MAG: hypothetical protein FOGNACKC_02905 [Anaerolineae bacterium]|nr:hypothetical protein [Anaerolineae bacterium]
MAKKPLAPPETLTAVAAQDYPGADILVSFPDQWQLVHRFGTNRPPLYIAGFPPTQERPNPTHFAGLSREINQSLDTYRLYKLFVPRSTPIFQVEWNSYIGRGRIIGGQKLQVQLQPLGQAQMWKGNNDGVLWECYLHNNRRSGINWQAQLSAFWQVVERDMGAARIFTQPHEPTFEHGYPDFLQNLGYAPDPEFALWWSKRWEPA